MRMIWVKVLIPALILDHHPILVDQMTALAIWDVIELNLLRVVMRIANLVVLVSIRLCDLCDAAVELALTSATKMSLKNFEKVLDNLVIYSLRSEDKAQSLVEVFPETRVVGECLR